MGGKCFLAAGRAARRRIADGGFRTTHFRATCFRCVECAHVDRLVAGEAGDFALHDGFVARTAALGAATQTARLRWASNDMLENFVSMLAGIGFAADCTRIAAWNAAGAGGAGADEAGAGTRSARSAAAD